MKNAALPLLLEATSEDGINTPDTIRTPLLLSQLDEDAQQDGMALPVLQAQLRENAGKAGWLYGILPGSRRFTMTTAMTLASMSHNLEASTIIPPILVTLLSGIVLSLTEQAGYPATIRASPLLQ